MLTNMDATASRLRKQRIIWMWRLDVEADEWQRYSDIENQMIELAYQQNENPVELDDFWIDFTQQIRISKKDSDNQKHIKRVTNMSDEYVREGRFVLEHPQLTTKSFETGGGAFLPATGVYMADINEELVENAVQGIEEVGAKLGKRKQAEFLANKLRKVKEKWNKQWSGRKPEKCSPIWSKARLKMECSNQEKYEWEKEVGECCATLYTIDSFFYKLVNQVMREAEKSIVLDGWFHENSRSKFASERDKNYGRILGPYCWILQKYLWTVPNEKDIIVFRSANLTNEMINDYKKHIGRRVRWDWLSSTTKKKEVALFYDGNTLFQIHIPPSVSSSATNAVSISSLSAFPIEDEVLLSIGTNIEITQVAYDSKVKKHVIDLKVKGKHLNESRDKNESECVMTRASKYHNPDFTISPFVFFFSFALSSSLLLLLTKYLSRSSDDMSVPSFFDFE